MAIDRAERIKSAIERSGKSYRDLETLTGIKRATLQRYANGSTTKIPLDVIGKLSAALNVSQEYLMGWEEKKDSPTEVQLSEGEKMMLELFRKIPEDRQAEAIDLLRVALKMQQRP